MCSGLAKWFLYEQVKLGCTPAFKSPLMWCFALCVWMLVRVGLNVCVSMVEDWEPSLKPTQWSHSFRARFGRLLFASKRDIASFKVRIYTASTLLCLWRETIVETGMIIDSWQLTLVQKISTWEGPWLARKLVRTMTRMSLMSLFGASSGPGSNFHSYIGILLPIAKKKKKKKKLRKFIKCFPHERNQQYGTVKECMVARHLPYLDFHIKCGLKYKGTVKVDIRTQSKPTEKSARNGAGSLQKYHKSSITGWLKLHKFPPSIPF